MHIWGHGNYDAILYDLYQCTSEHFWLRSIHYFNSDSKKLKHRKMSHNVVNMLYSKRDWITGQVIDIYQVW